MKSAAPVSLSRIVKRHGSTPVLHGVDLSIRAGEFFTLLGPSGSGKTSTLRIIAGLDFADEGQMFLDGADVTYVEPGDRDVAMVFQNYALYPHMSVFDNIGFPLKMSGKSGHEIDAAVRDVAGRVGIAHLLARKPSQLSGGQQQRCALARAIVREPKLFLLDEPLSNLDAKLRIEMRIELKRLQRSLNVTTIYVTHDQEEALSLSDRMAVFMEGRIVQIGTPDEVFSNPATIDVAAFLGNPPMNLLPARVKGQSLTIDGCTESMPLIQPMGDQAVVLGVRPAAVRLSDRGIPARVLMCESLGDDLILNLSVGTSLIRAKASKDQRPRDQDDVKVELLPEGMHLFDPSTRLRVSNPV